MLSVNKMVKYKEFVLIKIKSVGKFVAVVQYGDVDLADEML